MGYRLTRAAEADIVGITEAIAADGLTAGRRWVEQVERHCERLAEFPMLGVARDEIRPGLRLWPANKHLLLYRMDGNEVEIVRVIDGRRRWEQVLSRNTP